MAHSTLNAQGMDTGSNYRFGDKLLKPQFPRSLFDLSHLSTMTIKNAGYVFPISLWRTVPSDEFDISVRSLIRVLPQKVPLYSRQRLYVYAFYSRNGDLWENWNTFIRKGLSGNTVKTIPTLNYNNVFMDENTSVVPDSLSDYLGIPIGTHRDVISSGKFSALPYMMYMRIWRDYFFNHNFAVSGSPLSNTMEYLLPDNDDKFRLNDAGEIISFKEHDVTTSWLVNDVGSLPYYDGSSGGQFKFGLFPHLYPDDYFTSALPFQQRGTAPTIDVSISAVEGDIVNGLRAGLQHHPTYNDAPIISNNWQSGGTAWNRELYYASGYDISGTYSGTFDYNAVNKGFNDWLKDNLTSSGTVPTDPSYNNYRYGLAGHLQLQNASSSGGTITLNNLRELTVSQLELERMARTDGSYQEFGQTFFGVTPKNAVDYKPVYIGGSYTGLSFTEVLQTSASSGSSFLGQYAGHGIGADNDGYLGHIYCDDYGYIMILGCVMPDVYYHQGIDKHYTDLNQSQMLLPDRAKLGMQPILNQELYLQAYTVHDSDGNPVNENLFAYQDAFDDYRFMTNRIHGQIADKTKLSFFPYTQARDFDSLPNWSYEFAAATDVRKDYLAANIEDAYTAQFDVNVRAVRPLPYQSVPMTFGV